MNHQGSFESAGMFGMPPRKSIAEKFVEQRLRHKAPPTQGNNPHAVQPSLLPAQFQSFKQKTFIFIMSVENDNGTKSHGNISGNNVLQIIRQYAAANANCSRNFCPASALRQ